MWFLTLALGACSDNKTYWSQPQFEICNSGNTNAWCYPTAGASLIAKYKHLWDSQASNYYPTTAMETTISPPCNNVTNLNREVQWHKNIPWADYIYHETNTSMNMGHYMGTDPSQGTQLSAGSFGLKQFLDERMLHHYAVVTDIPRPANKRDNDFLTQHANDLPFLIHIQPICAQSAVGEYGDPADLGDIAKQFTIQKNNDYPNDPALGSSLGHTVVAWNQVDQTKWDVAANTDRGGVRTCSADSYIINTDACVNSITTLSFEILPTNSPSTSAATNSPSTSVPTKSPSPTVNNTDKPLEDQTQSPTSSPSEEDNTGVQVLAWVVGGALLITIALVGVFTTSKNTLENYQAISGYL